MPAEYLVERSRFVGKTFRLMRPDDWQVAIGEMTSAYPGANHYTWAYRIKEGMVRASDHGEPQGTAGLPMLNLLTRQNWEETMVVVVRYFGGIKLGRGGLVHAYQKSAQLALEATIPGVLTPLTRVQVLVDYPPYDRLQRTLKPIVLALDADFLERITLQITVPTPGWPAVHEALDRDARGRWDLIQHQETVELMAIQTDSE